MTKTLNFLLAVSLISAIGAPGMTAAESNDPLRPTPSIVVPELHRTVLSSQVPMDGTLNALRGATAWLNSPPLTAADLRGKVVLVDFWTYSCINWMRTLPYLRVWADKYRSQGLVLIGVHTPEFEFEKDLDNVRRYTQDTRIGYPVAIDSNYTIWRAFDNAYWPALYVVDAQGRIRHHRFGEGDYEQAERIIQRLLAEAGAKGIQNDVTSLDGSGLEAAADWSNLRTPETYVGYARAANFASPGGAAFDKRRDYTIPARLRLNRWALSGAWTVSKQFAVLNRPHGRIALRFHARDLHLVMGAASPGAPARFRILIDGQPPRADHGIDVDEQGNGTLAEPRLYQLVRQRSRIAERQFEIEFLDPGVEAYSFTFG